MEKYLNLNGNSSVVGFDVGFDFIWVYFSNKTKYLYTDKITGKNEVETMERLAQQGRDLGTYLGRKPYKRHSKKGTW